MSAPNLTDVVSKAVKSCIETAVKYEAEIIIKKAVADCEVMVRKAVGEVAVNVAQQYSVEFFGTDLRITVKMPKSELGPVPGTKDWFNDPARF